MSTKWQPLYTLGSALRAKLDTERSVNSQRFSFLLVRLGRSIRRPLAGVFRRPLPGVARQDVHPKNESGQEIADRLGLFAAGPTVKQRVGL